MIYITGDTHGGAERFKQFKKLFPKYEHYLFVCGDFGFVWDGGEKERRQLSKLEKYDCNIMFIEGTHDNLDELAKFPEEEFCGGKVRRLAKNVFWLQRGEIYDVEGVSVFALGGGESVDADERVAGVNWWPNEVPSMQELQAAKDKLDSVGGKVDIVLTHQNPRLELGLIEARSERINVLTAFLGEAARTLQYKRWFFGMDHVDRNISSRMTAVFEKVIEYKP